MEEVVDSNSISPTKLNPVSPLESGVFSCPDTIFSLVIDEP
jgi:hypothetical protein